MPVLMPVCQNHIGVGACSDLHPPCRSLRAFCNEEEGRKVCLLHGYSDFNTLNILYHPPYPWALSSWTSSMQDKPLWNLYLEIVSLSLERQQVENGFLKVSNSFWTHKEVILSINTSTIFQNLLNGIFEEPLSWNFVDNILTWWYF